MQNTPNCVPNQASRRTFLKSAALVSVATSFTILHADERPVLGQGDFRYRVVPDWGVLGAETPVANCHGLVRDREGHIILLTDHIKNNVIVYDSTGKLVHKWGTTFPGAHGLSIVPNGNTEALFITDLKTHKVVKTTLDGTVLNEWTWPKETGKYAKEDQYHPSWTLHLSTGEFFILDGYGLDYIQRFDAKGKFVSIFGGAEGGIVHWGPHGGMADTRDEKNPTLLIAMSDQQHISRLSLDGKKTRAVRYARRQPAPNPPA
ncbi:MAG: hypothetical protein WCT04_03080 [Planctomycetota bacterium]